MFLLSNKAIVGCMGCLVVGFVTVILRQPLCLWAIILVILMVDEIKD